MKNIISIIKSGLLMLLLAGTVSCESWISIEPTDRLSEDKVFSTQKGFQQALNGIYTEMNNNSVYGSNLTAGVLDVMGQYYVADIDPTYTYYYFARYGYSYSPVKTAFANVWAKMYSLISGVNIIIEKCEQPNSLTPQYQDLIKGEALALRAMLHFDLLRIFGPVMQVNQSADAIPYMTSADQNIQDILKADVVIENIISDLSASSELLNGVDPILTEGVQNLPSPTGNNDFNYRQYRLNYYAVQALLARVYLWNGDKSSALRIAKDVIESSSQVFPFSSQNTATGAYPDRMFSSEVIFSLYNSNRINVYNRLFAPALSVKNILTFAGTLNAGRVPELYDTQNDLRYKMWGTYTGGESELIFNKYADVSVNSGDTDSYCYMMPLIRLSELYLIAAECEPDLTQAAYYLNRVRNSRNCPDVLPSGTEGLMTYITAEFRKEMIGEGQMFFFYKRNAMQNIPNGSALSGNMNISLDSYVVPVPESETDKRM